LLELSRGKSGARNITCAVVLGFLTCLLATPVEASATILPATISENTTLTAEGSPYIGGSVTIESGVTVKAEPGAKVTVGATVVKGTLKAEGSAEEPVIFTSTAKSPNPGDWQNVCRCSNFHSGSGLGD
jgi:hypothetical protein